MPINKKTFCVAPWYSVFLDSRQRIGPCCRFDNLQDRPIEEYFVSSELQKVRDDLLKGIKNKNCTACWVAEENGGDSLRLISNRTIAQNVNLDISSQIQDPQLKNIKSFDLTLGNLCNLKCVMCQPALSSKILAEANANEDVKSLYKKNTDFAQKSYDWPKQEKFVEWCKTYLPNAIHIKFTGGEPFIIPWIESVIKEIPDQQKPKCVLHFTSNFTIINKDLFDHFKKFKEVWISVSVEGTQKTFEYMRYGHSWNKFEENLSAVMEMEIPNLILKVNHVVQSPSFQSIPHMVRYFDDKRIEIHPILLTTPKYFTLDSLTMQCKQDFMDEFVDYKGYNNKFITVVKNAVMNHIGHNPNHTQRMISHLATLDRARKIDYQKIIPRQNIE